METVLLVTAAVAALPGGLVAAYLVSVPHERWLSWIGGIVGSALVAAGIHYYMQISHPRIDPVSFWVGTFFACSVGIFAGALVADFLVGLGDDETESSTVSLGGDETESSMVS